MANINTANIENFDSMTAEEKVNALLGYEIPEEVDMSGFVAKSVFDKKAAEAANLAKQNKEKDAALKAKMSDDEQRKLEEEEAKKAEAQRYAELEEKYNAIIRKSTISEYTANFAALGMDEKMAAVMANALADGEADKLFSNLKKHMDGWKDAERKKMEAELMKNTPQPAAAGTPATTPEAGESPEMAFVMRRNKERMAAAQRAQEARSFYQGSNERKG